MVGAILVLFLDLSIGRLGNFSVDALATDSEFFGLCQKSLPEKFVYPLMFFLRTHGR